MDPGIPGSGISHHPHIYGLHISTYVHAHARMAPYYVRGAAPQDVWRVPHPTSYTLTVPTPGVPGSWTTQDLMDL